MGCAGGLQGEPRQPSPPPPCRYGHRSGGFFGYTHLTGGWEGGQAEYVRVPFGEPIGELIGKAALLGLPGCFRHHKRVQDCWAAIQPKTSIARKLPPTRPLLPLQLTSTASRFPLTWTTTTWCCCPTSCPPPGTPPSWGVSSLETRWPSGGRAQVRGCSAAGLEELPGGAGWRQPAPCRACICSQGLRQVLPPACQPSLHYMCSCRLPPCCPT